MPPPRRGGACGHTLWHTLSPTRWVARTLMDTSQDMEAQQASGGGDTEVDSDDASSYSYHSEEMSHAGASSSGGGAGGASGGGGSGSGSGGGHGAEESQFVKPRFRCLPAAALLPSMQAVVRSAGQMTGLSPGDALLALHHYGWRTERLMDAWAGDSAAALAAVGLSRGPDPPPLPSPLPSPAAYCAIAMEDVPWGDMDALPCGHFFSKAAWAENLASAMRDPSRAQLSRCPAFPSCRELVRARMFAAYLPPAEAQRFLDFGVRRYTESCRHIVWCPGADCTFAIMHTEGTR